MKKRVPITVEKKETVERKNNFPAGSPSVLNSLKMLWFDICKDCEVYLKVFHWKSVGLHSCSDVDWLYTFYSPWFTAESKEGGGGGEGGGESGPGLVYMPFVVMEVNKIYEFTIPPSRFDKNKNRVYSYKKLAGWPGVARG